MTASDQGESKYSDDLLSLPDDLLGKIIFYVHTHGGLAKEESLIRLESICKRLRQIVIHQKLWREACFRLSDLTSTLTSTNALQKKQGNLEGSDHLPPLLLAREAELRAAQSSLLYKRLFSYLSSWESSRLVEDVMSASSTGGACEARNMLTKFDHVYSDHMVGRPNHWRSSPSRDQSSSESVILKLAYPLSVITRIKLKVPNSRGPSGLHKPLSVQFHVGSVPKTTHALSGPTKHQHLDQVATECTWLQSSRIYSFNQEENSQVFHPVPMLCPGALLKIDLHGKGGPASIEEHEVEYDVRLVHVNVTGIPIVDLEIHEGSLRACPSPSQTTRKKWADATIKQSAPRFDSSDSDDSESWDKSDYFDSFI